MAPDALRVTMRAQTQEAPPRWAEQLLELLLNHRDRDTIIGDLREEYGEVVLPTRGRLGAQLWYMRQIASFLDPVKLGLLLGAAFGTWLLIHTRLDPLARETPTLLLMFFGPMFALWAMAGFAAASRDGRLLDGIKVGATVAFVTFLVYDLSQIVRVNLFLEAIRHRSDWHHIMVGFESSQFESLRSYVNYVGLISAPFKILAATAIGACMGGIGGLLAAHARRTARALCIALAAIQLEPLVPFATPTAWTQERAEAPQDRRVRVAVIPDPLFFERDEQGLYLNCDFRLENQTGERIRVTRIEVLTLDAGQRISSRRFLSGQGSVTPGLETLPRRDIESGAVVDIFNPFHTLDPLAPAVSVRFQFQFIGSRRYDAEITVHPVLYRPRTKLVLPLRGRVLVYDGHDYYSHHRRIDLSNPAIKEVLAVNPVRYAYDFSPVDTTGAWYRGDPAQPMNWFAYDAPVYAPAAGRVVSVANDVPDNSIENGVLVYPEPPNDIRKRLLGNYVVIDHGGGEYSLLAHLKEGTVTVGLDDRVNQDQLVGRIGFSGDTGAHVHLHYQLADAANPLSASSLPVVFSGFRRFGVGRGVVRDGLLHTGQYIER